MATPLHQNLSLWLLLLLSVCRKKFKLEAKFAFIKLNKTNLTVSCLYLHNRGLFLNLVAVACGGGQRDGDGGYETPRQSRGHHCTGLIPPRMLPGLQK